jgi:hypothetical protein
MAAATEVGGAAAPTAAATTALESKLNCGVELIPFDDPLGKVTDGPNIVTIKKTDDDVDLSRTLGNTVRFAFDAPLTGLTTTLPPGSQPTRHRVELAGRAYWITFKLRFDVAYGRITLDDALLIYPFDVNVKDGSYEETENFMRSLVSNPVALKASTSRVAQAERVFPLDTPLEELPKSEQHMLNLHIGREPSTMTQAVHDAIKTSTGTWRAFRWFHTQMEVLRVKSESGKSFFGKLLKVQFDKDKTTPEDVTASWNWVIMQRNAIVAYHLLRKYMNATKKDAAVNSAIAQITGPLTASKLRAATARGEQSLKKTTSTGTPRETFALDVKAGKVPSVKDWVPTPVQIRSIMNRRVSHWIADPDAGKAAPIPDSVMQTVKSELDEELEKDPDGTSVRFAYNGQTEQLGQKPIISASDKKDKIQAHAILYYGDNMLPYEKLRPLQIACKSAFTEAGRARKRDMRPGAYVSMPGHAPVLDKFGYQYFYPNSHTNELLPYELPAATVKRMRTAVTKPDEKKWKADYEAKLRNGGKPAPASVDADGDDDAIDAAMSNDVHEADKVDRVLERKFGKAGGSTGAAMTMTTEQIQKRVEKEWKSTLKRWENSVKKHGKLNHSPEEPFVLLMDSGQYKCFKTAEQLKTEWYSAHPIKAQIEPAAAAAAASPKVGAPARRPAAAAAAAAAATSAAVDIDEIDAAAAAADPAAPAPMVDDDVVITKKPKKKTPSVSDPDADADNESEAEQWDDEMSKEIDMERALDMCNVQQSREEISAAVREIFKNKGFRRDPVKYISMRSDSGKLTGDVLNVLNYAVSQANGDHDDDSEEENDEFRRRGGRKSLLDDIKPLDVNAIDWKVILKGKTDAEASRLKDALLEVLQQEAWVADPKAALDEWTGHDGSEDDDDDRSDMSDDDDRSGDELTVPLIRIVRKYYLKVNHHVFKQGKKEFSDMKKRKRSESVDAPVHRDEKKTTEKQESPAKTPRPAAAAAAATAPASPALVPAVVATTTTTSTNGDLKHSDSAKPPPAKRARILASANNSVSYTPIKPDELHADWYARHVRETDEMVRWFAVIHSPTPHIRLVDLPIEHYEAVSMKMNSHKHAAALEFRYKYGVHDTHDGSFFISTTLEDALSAWSTEQEHRVPYELMCTITALECHDLRIKLGSRELALKDRDRLVERMFNLTRLSKNAPIPKRPEYRMTTSQTRLPAEEPSDALMKKIKAEEKKLQEMPRDELAAKLGTLMPRSETEESRVFRRFASVDIAASWLERVLSEICVDRGILVSARAVCLLEGMAEARTGGWNTACDLYDKFRAEYDRITSRMKVCCAEEAAMRYAQPYAKYSCAWALYSELVSAYTREATTKKSPADTAAAEHPLRASASPAPAAAAAAATTPDPALSFLDHLQQSIGGSDDIKAKVKSAFGQLRTRLSEISVCPICMESNHRNYRMWGCGHSICVGCFNAMERERIARRDRDDGSPAYKCPHCRLSQTTKPIPDVVRQEVAALMLPHDPNAASTEELDRRMRSNVAKDVLQREAKAFLDAKLREFEESKCPRLGFTVGDIDAHALRSEIEAVLFNKPLLEIKVMKLQGRNTMIIKLRSAT